MNPICADCLTEMPRQGATEVLAYQHNNCPVDYSRGVRYHCVGCDHSVYIPIGYAYVTLGMEPGHAIPVTPTSPKKGVTLP